MSALADWDHYWVFRLPYVLLAVAGAIALDRAAMCIGATRSLRLLLAALTVGWLSRLDGGAVCLRADMVFFAGVAYSTYALVVAAERPRHLLMACLATVLALTCHPNAVLGFVPLLTAAPTAIPALRRMSRKALALSALAICSAAGASFGVLVWGFEGPTTAWAELTMFTSAGHFNYGITEEYRRYEDLLRDGGVFTTASLCTLALVAILTGPPSADRVRRGCGAGALVILLLLASGGAKWSIYLVAVFPPVLVGCSRLVTSTLGARLARPDVAAALVLASAAIAAKTLEHDIKRLQQNNLAWCLLGDPVARSERAELRALVAGRTLNAAPFFFPYLREAEFHFGPDPELDLTHYEQERRVILHITFNGEVCSLYRTAPE